MTSEEQRQVIERIRQSLTGSSGKILLIEDIQEDAELAISVLKGAGLVTVWAKDAKEAFDAVRQTNYWVILLDLKLHNVSGIEVLRTIKDIKADSRVIVLTGAYDRDSEECKEALRQGAVWVMLKPLTAEQIGLIFSQPGQEGMT